MCENNSTPGILIEEIGICIQASSDVLESAILELLHAHEQSCYIKLPIIGQC